MRERSRLPAPLDACLAMLGVAFGGVSLAYPLTLDAGVNYYVAREWLLRGALPYRDSFDHRAPGIYAVHAACIAIFGDHAWGIRVAELAAVVALGWLAAMVVTPRGERPAAGTRGAAVLLAAVFYYGFFDYWCTAQCELWCALAIVGAFAAALRARTARRAALAAGLACGAALLVKPPVLPLAAVAFALVVARARGERSRARIAIADTAVFAAAVAAPIGATLAYFAASGAWGALVDVLVGANAYYVMHEPARVDAAFVARHARLAWGFFAPYGTLILAALAAAGAWSLVRRGRARSSWLLVCASLVASLAAVAVQRKFYLYHWSLLVAPIAMLGALVARAMVRHASPRAAWVRAGALAAVAFGFFAQSGGPFHAWSSTSAVAISLAGGRASHEDLARTLTPIDRFYWYRVRYDERERVGVWLRDHSSPDDKILVRGMAAEVYAISGRRAPGRFFWSFFLSLPTREYHREQWLREDLDAIDRDPPRYVVAYANLASGPDSPSYFAPLGYLERVRDGDFVILERGLARTASR